MALAEQAELLVKLSLRDELSRGLKGAQSGLQGLDKSFARTQASLNKTATNLKRGALVVGGAVAGGFALAIREASSFEAQMNTINTVAQVSEEQLASFGDGMRRLSRDSGTAIEDLTTGFYDLVSAGISAADSQMVLEEANTLAIGGLATTAETIDLLTTAINAYGMEAKDASDISDYFAQAIGAGKVNAAELAASFAQVAPIAASSDIEIEELAAGYAQLTAAGVPAAEASTQMRAAIVALQKPTADMQKLQDKLNVNFLEVAEEQGLAAAYQMIREEADRAGIPMVKFTGRIEAANYALGVTGENAEGYAENLELVEEATEGSGVAAEQAAERQKGLSFQWARSKAIGRDLARMFGTEMLPGVTRVVTKVNELLTQNWGKLERVAGRVGDAFDNMFSDAELEGGMRSLTRRFDGLMDRLSRADVEGGVKSALGFLRDLPWSTIADGLRITGEAMGIVIKGFRSLPPDMQKILIGALALNKATGGLVTSVFKDVAGIALKSLTTINAANVTVIGKSVIGPGGGVPGTGGAGPVAPTAGLGGIAGLLGILTAGIGGGIFVKGLDTQAAGDLTSAMENVNWSSVNADQAAQMAPFFEHLGNGLSILGFDFGQQVATLGSQMADVEATIAAQTATTSGKLDGLVRPEHLMGLSSALDVGMVTIGSQIASASSALGVDLMNLSQATGDLAPRIDRLGTVTDTALAGVKARLDTNNNGLLQTREVLAGKLGITVDTLQAFKQQSGGNDQRLAERLGISVEQLRALRESSRSIAERANSLNQKSAEQNAELDRIRNQTALVAQKDWSPTLRANVTVQSTFSVSARAVARATGNYLVNARPRPI